MTSNDVFHRAGFHIDGTLQRPRGGRELTVISPSTEQPVGSVFEATAADVDAAVAAARRAFDSGPWPRMSFEERADILERIAEGMQAHADVIRDVVVSTTGTPVSVVPYGKIKVPQAYFRYAAQLIRGFADESSRDGLISPSRVRLVPRGVVGVLIPWNLSMLGPAGQLATLLASGCTAVLKPSPFAPLDAYLIAQIAEEAGVPAGVINVIPGDYEAGQRLVSHPDVDKIVFVGSTSTGKAIAQACAQQLKPYVLELGGNAAAVILDDAEADVVAAGIVRSALLAGNAGQACVAQTRVLVPRRRKDEFGDAIVAAVRGVKVGDPFDPSTAMGPLISEVHRDRVQNLWDVGRTEARVLTGGGRPAGLGQGYYLEPTVFADVTNDTRIAREEIFGPAVTIIPVDSEEEAVRVANDTEYGLSSSVWSADPERAGAVGRRLQVGTVWVNNSFTFDPGTPFGGWKESGVGRNGGPEGFNEYMQTQTLFGLSAS